MHEYLDLAAETGYFDDPRILYDLTPAEIAITIAGKAARDRQQHQMENVRAGTLRPRSTTRSGRNERIGYGPGRTSSRTRRQNSRSRRRR